MYGFNLAVQYVCVCVCVSVWVSMVAQTVKNLPAM